MAESTTNKALMTQLDEAFITVKEQSLLENVGASDVSIAREAGIAHPEAQATRIANKPHVKAHLEAFKRKIRTKVEKRYTELLMQDKNLGVSARMVEVGIEALGYKSKNTIGNQYNIGHTFNAQLDPTRLDAITKKLKLLAKVTKIDAPIDVVPLD